MGKLDEILRSAGGHIAESTGADRPRGAGTVSHGASPAGPPPVPARWQGVAKSKNAIEIPLAKLDRDPEQPREEFDAESLERLAESLKVKGQLQPIRVRWDEGRGVYLIICGERRWRAARMAGLATLSAIVHEGPLDPGELLSIQVVENCLRDDLKPIEQAKGFQRLMELHGWSARQVARELSLTQSSVARALALLDLPAAVQDLVEEGKLAPATAVEVGRLGRPEDQAEIAERVIAERLTRAQVVAAVRARKTGTQAPAQVRRDRVEYREGGTTVLISGEAVSGGPGAIRAVLARILERLDTDDRGQTPEQAA
jgi:ParB family chromosome partitioning protein